MNLTANPYFLPSGEATNFNVVIEIPYGSQDKFELDEETGLLHLDRVLYGAAFYPLHYGFIPSTKADDGDACDALVFMTTPVPTMTVVPCRAIGMITMTDSGEQDNKILAVPTVDPRFDDVTDIGDLPQHILKDIVDFFTNMQKFKKGEWIKPNEVLTIHDAQIATEEVAKYLNNYTG